MAAGDLPPPPPPVASVAQLSGWTIATVALLIVVSGLGGSVNYYRNLGALGVFRGKKLALFSFVGSVTGTLCGLLVFESTKNIPYTLVAGGFVGMLGFKGIDLISDYTVGAAKALAQKLGFAPVGDAASLPWASDYQPLPRDKPEGPTHG